MYNSLVFEFDVFTRCYWPVVEAHDDRPAVNAPFGIDSIE